MHEGVGVSAHGCLYLRTEQNMEGSWGAGVESGSGGLVGSEPWDLSARRTGMAGPGLSEPEASSG